MYFVYFLRSLRNPKKTYVGFTKAIETRLAIHNAGKVPHTSRHAPWELIGYIAVKDRARALALEKYFKSGSGHAFWHKRFM
ncbi:MAG: GIY-YIG nuclease family protein [Verrucomicrobia bacterium]|nr:GIY-YIG nuclease family protein [Verrucomicrobiota bacterium]